MPKNKGKGGKNRRRGKNENDAIKRELIVAEPGQTYAEVLKMLGSGNVEALCNDNQRRTCHIRGKMNKKVWINVGDIILISLRDFQNDKADIIMKYNSDEVGALKSNGQLCESLGKGETNQFGPEHTTDDISFNETINESKEKNPEENLNNFGFRPDNYISSDSDNDDYDYDDYDDDTLSDI